jgi:triosephosphate isomerase (TIM)
MRTPYIAGNWKMNLSRSAAFELAQALAAGARAPGRPIELAVAPPFVYIEMVASALRGSGIAVGAQNVAQELSGAFTGEISAAMLKECGAAFAIVGHSERRHVYGEKDKLINARLRMGLESGLSMILCVGETLAERDGGRTEEVVREQLVRGLEHVTVAGMERVTLAYEPVWAIGTGRNASAAQASEVHLYLRGLLAGLYDDRLAERVRIQYGGSVKPQNAAELLSAPGVDGALVGGAALEPASFLAIAAAARAR